jgi:hypothetical protein
MTHNSKTKQSTRSIKMATPKTKHSTRDIKTANQKQTNNQPGT